jgi:hypothetical protein
MPGLILEVPSWYLLGVKDEKPQLGSSAAGIDPDLFECDSHALRPLRLYSDSLYRDFRLEIQIILKKKLIS